MLLFGSMDGATCQLSLCLLPSLNSTGLLYPDPGGAPRMASLWLAGVVLGFVHRGCWTDTTRTGPEKGLHSSCWGAAGRCSGRAPRAGGGGLSPERPSQAAASCLPALKFLHGAAAAALCPSSDSPSGLATCGSTRRWPGARLFRSGSSVLQPRRCDAEPGTARVFVHLYADVFS